MYGEHGSHMFFATHASILTRGPSNSPYRTAFIPTTTLPYHFVPKFGVAFSSVTLSAQGRLTSELLRTL
jgi:hypothetical protein